MNPLDAITVPDLLITVASLLALGVLYLAINWARIRAWLDRQVECKHLERQLAEPEFTDAWDACADPPCSVEDGWECRAHCPNCTSISPCLGHDTAWVREMERRLAQ